MKNEPLSSTGTAVHYLFAVHAPADIRTPCEEAEILEVASDDTTTLLVTSGPNPRIVRGVVEDETRGSGHTWHLPEQG